MKQFADGKLSAYKKPKSVEFVEEIPATPYGKMDKKALWEPYWEGSDHKKALREPYWEGSDREIN